jgi:hypothetical protein
MPAELGHSQMRNRPLTTTPPERNMIARRRWFRHWALKSPARVSVHRACQGSCNKSGRRELRTEPELRFRVFYALPKETGARQVQEILRMLCN